MGTDAVRRQSRVFQPSVADGAPRGKGEMGNESGMRLAELALAMVTMEEAGELARLVDGIVHPAGTKPDPLALLRQIRDGGRSTAFSSLALYVNRLARDLDRSASAATRAPLIRSLLNLREKLSSRRLEGTASVARDDAPTAPAEPGLSLEDGIIDVYERTVGRTPAASEIDIWKTNFDNGLPFHQFMLLMERGPEAVKHAAGKAIADGVGDGEFIQMAHELVQNRGATAWEIDFWRRKLEDRSITRAQLLAEMFEASASFQRALAEAPPHDGLSCSIMGTTAFLNAAQWDAQAEAMADAPPPPPDERYQNRFHIRGEPRVLVSALASLYRGGDFIEQFMDNITSQGVFDDYCELVIVDADSPENEYETIKRYLARHRNIVYLRMNYRIGIYDAWNVAAKAARGEYLTNTNMDDLRRHDSLEIQAAALDNLPFADVVYQDLYYTFDPRLSFEQIAAFRHETVLPVITPHNLIKFNSPHNAPMWRRKLHDELGWFDTRYRSAGDYEFWMRCLDAGKKFYKINDPHVVYYQNPKGLSTRPDTRGVAEAMDIHKRYCRKLMPDEVVMATADYARALDPALAVPPPGKADRYVMAQEALRNLARRGKFAAPDGAPR